MAVTLSSEFAVPLFRGGIPSCFRGFDVFKHTDPHSAFLSGEVSGELSAADRYASMPGRIVGLQSSVHRVLVTSAYSKIGPSVIQAVAVDVVNNKAFWCAHDQSVHQETDLSLWAACASNGAVWSFDDANRVKRFAKSTQLIRAPLMGDDEINVFVIEKNLSTAAELQFLHDCSFSNSLCGVAAARKDRGFGDQPSRNETIVWQ